MKANRQTGIYCRKWCQIKVSHNHKKKISLHCTVQTKQKCWNHSNRIFVRYFCKAWKHWIDISTHSIWIRENIYALYVWKLVFYIDIPLQVSSIQSIILDSFLLLIKMKLLLIRLFDRANTFNPFYSWLSIHFCIRSKDFQLL